MKHATRIALLACLVSWLGPRPLLAQACKDEETMSGESGKALVELVDTVKKESLQDFQRAYHQKSCLNKLTFSRNAVDGVLSCLDKAVQDTTAAKEDLDAYKAKREVYAKRKERIERDRKALKDATEAKDAKALIEKFDLSN